MALAEIQTSLDWDWAGAAVASRRAAGLRPGDAGILSVAGLALSTLGDFGTAREFLEESVRRDPLNLHSALRLGLLQEFLGDFDAALAIVPDIQSALYLRTDRPGHILYNHATGIAPAEPSRESTLLREWLERGFAGAMHYVGRRVEDRLLPVGELGWLVGVRVR